MAHKESSSHGYETDSSLDRGPTPLERSPVFEVPAANADLEHAPAIAANLQRLRRERRVTLHMLAHASGISEFVLARIEDGSETPNIRLVWSVANALGVPFSELLRDAAEHRGKRSEAPKVTTRAVVASKRDDRSSTALFELTFPVGASETLPRSEEAVSEHLLVTAGSFRLRQGESEQKLEVGESVVLAKGADRLLVNVGDSVAVAYLKLSPEAQ